MADRKNYTGPDTCQFVTDCCLYGAFDEKIKHSIINFIKRQQKKKRWYRAFDDKSTEMVIVCVYDILSCEKIDNDKLEYTFYKN